MKKIKLDDEYTLEILYEGWVSAYLNIYKIQLWKKRSCVYDVNLRFSNEEEAEKHGRKIWKNRIDGGV